MKILRLALGLVLLTACPVLADVLYGSIKYRGGGKVPDGRVTISTDVNERKAYPKNGQYRLDMRKKAAGRVTVLVDGKRYKTIEMKGDRQLDIVIEKRR
jgi:hypothetical protein